MKTYAAVAVLVVACAGAAYYFLYIPERVVTESGVQNTREAQDPAISTRAACEAACRNQYGGSGSAGFDACIRGCGAGSVLREECPSERPACAGGESPVCRRGVWYCRDAAVRDAVQTDDVNVATPTSVR